MSEDATLHLYELGQQALDRLAGDDHGSRASVLRTACIYYLADRDAGRTAWRAPRFDSGSHRPPGPEIELDHTTWRELAAEADRQGVSPEALGVHALLYFLSDLGSGRLGRRLGDALDSCC